MNIFFTDLDNTLIYSYKHEFWKDNSLKRNVELYEGRQISFITEKTYRLLLELKKHMGIVPVTTRTIEQYSRIDLGIGKLPSALVCNGGVLLKDGNSDQAWYEQSLRLIADSREELAAAASYLEQEKSRILEVRDIQKLFLFTKCRSAQDAAMRIRQALHPCGTEVFTNGEKLYVVPKKLNKGTAVARFTQYAGAGHTAAAGDSIFDLPMLKQADIAAAPAGCGWSDMLAGRSVYEMPGKRLFSEELLEFVLERMASL